jgi:acetoin utilization deacetylase AcuC-like enzyme
LRVGDVPLPTGLVADVCYRNHHTSAGHPESPDRFDAAVGGIREAVPADRLLEIPSREATLDELMLCHTAEYVSSVSDDVRMGHRALRTGDTDICRESFDVARRAVGGALNAVDAVLGGQVRNAFCALRPPGHHAEADRGMGFCIFNNAAIAARYALQYEGIDRVLIADWDVHHGNGTQWIFYDDPAVFYFSTHQWPHYPGTGMRDDVGADSGRGFTLNAPLAGGSARVEVLGAFESKLIPAMRVFNPQFVIISAGFDCEAGDPLGGFGLQQEDFVDLTRIMLRIADEHAEGRLISVLEGGYRLDGLAALCGAHVYEIAAESHSS